MNIYGCDSIVITNLTVNPTQTTNLTETICHYETLEFNGQILTTSGTYQAVLPTWQGCDSTVNLNLTVQPEITLLNTVILDGTNVPLGSINITPSGDTLTQQYLWSNGATTQDVTNLGTGIYTLTITDAVGCQDTFSFEIGTVRTVMIDANKRIEVKLYPNPTRSNQLVTLEFDNEFSQDLRYQIVLSNGQLVANGNLPKQKLQHQIKIPEQTGMYYLQLILDNQVLKIIPFLVE